MDRIVSRAIDLCTFVYAATGILGYVAFGNSASGNAILDLQPSMFTEVIKFGFVMSVLLSFPLLVFPCRSSIYSMLFGRVTVSPYDPNGNESIPEFRFKAMTAFIIGSTLLVGLAVPNIEFVLGLVGATIGTVVCVILPSICLLQVTDVDKSSKDRPKAQIVLLIGLTILLFGTYYSIYPEGSKVDISLANDIPSFVKDDEVIKLMEKVQPEIEQAKILNKGIIDESPTGDKRVEPALPFESDGGAPVETKEEEDKEVEEIIKEETRNEEHIEREEEDKEVEEIIKEETKNEERVESVVNEPEIDGNAEKKLMVKFENLKEEPINKERDIAKSEYKKVRISPGEYQPNKEIEKANKFIPKGRKALNKNLNLIIPKKIHNELSNIEEKWIIAKEEKSNAVKKSTRENQENVNPKYTLESAGKDGVHLNIMNNKVNDEDNPRGNIESLQKSGNLATKKDGEENRSNLIQEESKQESINGGGRDILSLDKADASINAIQQPALGEKAINNSVLKEDSVQFNPVKRQVKVTESVHYNTTVIQHLNVVPEKEV
ncbi:hypothetical protein QYM36_013562 [Artemia franciscana]|nr:hypothetical protein QYM36_013562 [Artemia franciscana]